MQAEGLYQPGYVGVLVVTGHILPSAGKVCATISQRLMHETASIVAVTQGTHVVLETAGSRV
jgi:hypothetical protein